MPFIANTEAQQQEMLKAIGAGSIDELFSDIPENLRCGSLDIPKGLSELEVYNQLRGFADMNANELTCFLGGGFYDHYIPSCIDSIVSRSEYYTAYTPYQPEASQGTLQAIFEYQTMICRLTDMDVSNASLYDGGTALYEAAMMALRITGRNRIVVDSAVNPIYRNMLNSYTSNLSIDFAQVDTSDCRINREKLKAAMDDDTAAVIVQNPNFFGAIDDFSDVADMAHEKGSLLIVSAYPLALGILKSPGMMGADIVTGEGQSLGIPLSFGGPYLGFMAVKKKYVRKMPGRLAGQTQDARGRRGWVLTLQAREQHIRRDKAMSNICSNQALMALRAAIYMSVMGKRGLADVAALCVQKAEYAKSRLEAINGVSVRRRMPTFNEFVVDLPVDAGSLVGKMVDRGFAAGFPLERYYPGMEKSMLVAVTEKRTSEEIGMFAEALEALV